MRFHEDRIAREILICQYLTRRIQPEEAEEFERHYLVCDECFEEMRATLLLMAGLTGPAIERRRVGGVALLEFRTPVELVRQSPNLPELSARILEQNDTKVLIDLSRVSRIDSAGLGLLMACYSHTVRQRGTLKLLRPSVGVRNLLRLTKVNSVLECYDDEREAVQSFECG